MNVGMLWFDNDPKVDLEAKIERAADYYRSKYGKKPTLCFVHPSMLIVGAFKNGQPGNDASQPAPNKRLANCGIEIRSNRSVLPNHFWIGVNGSVETTVA